MIPMPKGANKKVKDFMPSRYACYLTVQNDDPRKEVIAFGQTYFAIQPHCQEIADTFNQLGRGQQASCNPEQGQKLKLSMLVEAAHRAGIVEQVEYAEFQNAGYMGSYGVTPERALHRNRRF